MNAFVFKVQKFLNSFLLQSEVNLEKFSGEWGEKSLTNLIFMAQKFLNSFSL